MPIIIRYLSWTPCRAFTGKIPARQIEPKILFTSCLIIPIFIALFRRCLLVYICLICFCFESVGLYATIFNHLCLVVNKTLFQYLKHLRMLKSMSSSCLLVLIEPMNVLNSSSIDMSISPVSLYTSIHVNYMISLLFAGSKDKGLMLDVSAADHIECPRLDSSLYINRR